MSRTSSTASSRERVDPLPRPARPRDRTLALASLLFAAGCATDRLTLPDAASTELVDVPFFAQTEYQCGPAALATILAHQDLPVEADDLSALVYIEGLRGSLQPELLAATRRHGLIPYPIDPRPDALLAELGAGRPVLVLQNLGLKILPVWHYAVVVGVDFERDRIVLRSGTERRHLERAGGFLRSWRRAGRWGFVAIRAGTLPANAEPERFIRALAAAEPWLGASAARAAYLSAFERWPDNELVLFAAATRSFRDRRWDEAASRLRNLLARRPQNAAARNNLANALAEKGCYREALLEAERAAQLAAENAELAEAIHDTLSSVRAGALAAASEDCR